MWGNQRGWIFAACMAVPMIALLVIGVIPPGPTAPTGTLTLAMQPADLTDDPASIVAAPGGDADAAVPYRKAADDWNANTSKYDGLPLTEAAKNVPEAVKQVVAATDDGKMDLFASHPDEVINYDSEHPTLDGLVAAGTMANRLALLYTTDTHKDFKQATIYASAAFNLGRHLYQERMSFVEWTDGLNLMEDSAKTLQKTQSDTSAADTCRQFASNLNDYLRNKVEPIWEIIGTIDKDETTKYAGDYFQIAAKSPERMWRVEAILRLGRLKFDGTTRGDQRWAKKTLQQMVSGPPGESMNPTMQAGVHSAVLAAANLTPEEFNTIK